MGMSKLTETLNTPNAPDGLTQRYFSEQSMFPVLVLFSIVVSMFSVDAHAQAHPTRFMPSTDICYKARVLFLNFEVLSRHSGIPNPPSEVTEKDFDGSDIGNCKGQLDGALQGLQTSFTPEGLVEMCGLLESVGITGYASMFVEDGWPADFGHRQALNLAIICDHAIYRGVLSR